MKKKRSHLKYFLIAAVALIIFAIAGRQAGWFGHNPLVNVTAETVELRNITETITANGRIRPQTEVKISPDVSGEIVELNIAEGDEVEAGQLLLKINPDTYISMRDRAEASLNSSRANLANSKARLAQVEAQFEQAELNYNRNKKLWEKETISRAEYESALSSYKVAAAEVEAGIQSVQAAEYSVKSNLASLREAEDNLRKTTIYSPVSGTVSKLSVEQGERVVGTAQMAGTEMMRIANLNRMEVLVQVNENDIVRVKHNDTALIDIDAYPRDRFRGVVTEIANTARETASTDQVTNFDVKIMVLPESYSHIVENNPNRKYPFLPGMSGTVEIRTNTRHNIPSVPIQAVTTRPDSLLAESKASEDDKRGLKEVVFKISENETVSLQKVVTGIQDNMYIEIISGLSPGDKVATGPFNAVARMLTDGMQISVISRERLYN